MTMFDVRIPGLKMTVVAADGQNIQPVEIDEFRIGNAETYDVIVMPEADRAYTLFAQTIDRTGFARGTLTTNPNLRAETPALDAAPILSHQDMGMNMSSMDHSAHESHDMKNMDSTDHIHHDMSSIGNMEGMDHSGHDMNAMQASQTNLAKAGFGSNF